MLAAGMQVLDACAAPGSKTAQLLEMLHNGSSQPTGEFPSYGLALWLTELAELILQWLEETTLPLHKIGSTSE